MTDHDETVDIDEVLEQEQRNRRALLTLLDRERERRHHLLAISSRMGTTRSLVTTVALEWVSNKVKFASELPIFHEHIDEDTKKVVIDEKTAAIIQQRAPDWSRQFPMTLYLAKRPTHKFPPILVVVTQTWVDDPDANEWGAGGKAIRDSVSMNELDSEGRVVDLHISDKNDFLYAIDGQHRLMAIQGLATLLAEGTLYARNKQGRQKAKSYTVDDIIEHGRGRISRSGLQQLLGERIGIEIIPAVCRGETREEANRRLRSIFVHVNKTAQPLSKGEIALLDEDNGFAVVGRAAMVTHKVLKQRVNAKKNQLAESSSDLSTLEAIVKVSEKYLGHNPDFSDWFPDERLELPLRPEEGAIDEGILRLEEFLDHLGSLPSMRDVINGADPSLYRQTGDDEHGNLLFRPLGQIALADAIGVMVWERQQSLKTIFKKLADNEAKGMLKIDSPKTPWFGVMFDPGKKKMVRSTSAITLCAKLFLHVLGNGTPDDEEREKLREAFAVARTIDADSNKAIDLTGRKVNADNIQLPAPW